MPPVPTVDHSRCSMGKSKVQRKIEISAVITTVLLGWLFLLPLRTPNSLVRWSYDLLQLVLPQRNHTGLAIIYMDEQAMQDYRQRPEQWNRSLHARLLDRLTEDQPRVVVFDVMLTQASDPVEDNALARAIRRNGRVVLAGDKVPVPGLARGYSIVPPLEIFETNAAAWGTAKVQTDPDRVGRRYDAGDDQRPGLAWAAAVADATVTRNSERRLKEQRWLNYYGSARPFESVSMTYTNAETSERGFFKDKAIFIGGQPETLSRGEITDVFGTPFTKWNGAFIPGVEIMAIAYANLVHEDWLRRAGTYVELGILLVAGFTLGFGLAGVRLRTAAWLSLLFAVLLAGITLLLLLLLRVWFPWMVVGLVQLPCALLFSFFNARTAPLSQSPIADVHQETPVLSPAQVSAVSAAQLNVPDHSLIRCIGQGAYGQVWIARNAIGLCHAVKVVYRNRFGIEEPYERALRGIQKFMPISRSHEGFVHILHVGRNDAAGFFFYIMEAGDDQRGGQQIEPDIYAPKTLASELQRRQVIPPRECLEFMLGVTDAVERLHQHKLIHRDIKPANLIFVNGRPKLADIDLVTDLTPHGEASWIGTEGYMAPEGPGTAAADVFSLGRILYVALTGKLPAQCPELPTSVANQPDCDLFLELNQVSCKACETDLRRRYSSASLMREDLLKVSNRLRN